MPLTNPYPSSRSVIIMDNYRIHKTEEVHTVETHTSLCLYSTPFTFHPTALLLSIRSELPFSALNSLFSC